MIMALVSDNEGTAWAEVPRDGKEGRYERYLKSESGISRVYGGLNMGGVEREAGVTPR